MKVKLGSLTSIILVIFCMFVSLSYAIEKDSIVGIWLFDEGQGNVVHDSSSNGHDGEITGKVERVNGKFGEALEFSGEGGNFVVIQHKDSLNLETWSITALINLKTTGALAAIVAKQQGNVRNYDIGVREDGSLWVSFTQGDGNWKTTDGSKVADKTWHHVAGTYDGKSTRIYVDGQLVTEKEWGGKPDTNQENMTIGALADGSWAISGAVDEVGLFSSALNESDVNNLMTDGLGQFVLAVKAESQLSTTWATLKKEF